MAIEAKRGCGYRVVGGLYLVSEGLGMGCDRLPYPLESCPVCGGGIHFTRGMQKINPLKLFREHRLDYHGSDGSDLCPDNDQFCKPTDEIAYLLGVGSKFYSPSSFISEAEIMGVSKRIGAVPKELVMGKTWVYLTHPKAINIGKDGSEKTYWRLGIFCAFRPLRIEQLIRESEAKPEKLAELQKRGITPVIVPDGDKDHEK